MSPMLVVGTTMGMTKETLAGMVPITRISTFQGVRSSSTPSTSLVGMESRTVIRRRDRA